jgi:general secretion pathway protein N
MRRARAGVVVVIALGAVASAGADEAIGPTAALETGAPRRYDESAAAPFSAGPPAEQGESAPRGNPLWSIPLRALTETRERPLFSPSRRPLRPIVPAAPDSMQPPPPFAAAPVEPERPPLTLVGTVVGGRPDAGVALLLDATTNIVARARVGESASGWRVSAVAERSIVVEKSGLSVTLALPDPRETAPIAGPRPPPLLGTLRRTR